MGDEGDREGEVHTDLDFCLGEWVVDGATH